MQLQTSVTLPDYPFQIKHKDKISCIGSCFAENVGNKFKENKFNTLINPFGVLYNPGSIAICLDTILNKHFDETRTIKHNNLWHSFLHHSSFSNTSKEAVLSRINHTLSEAHHFLKETRFLFITLGTAQVFEYQDNIVANCHKIPAKAFTRRRLSVDEIVNTLGHSIKDLKAINPDISIIFSVSPVRYPKDGMNENSLNKATLLLAVEQLTALENCFYFPAYEIVLDELRDYRFFAEDMTHPHKLAITYIWEKLEKALFSKQTLQLKQQINKLVTASLHRPFNTDPVAHQQFLSAMYNKASNLQKQHPEIDLKAELAYFSTK